MYASSISKNIIQTKRTHASYACEWFLVMREFMQAISFLKWLTVVFCLFMKMGLSESNCNFFLLAQLNYLLPIPSFLFLKNAVSREVGKRLNDLHSAQKQHNLITIF